MSEINDQTDYYELLGVDPDATADQIKKAYRKAAMKWHPDRNFGNVEEATRVFQFIEHAYSILSDDHERAWYDGHRNLSTDDTGAIQATKVDIMGLFSARAYFGFEDNPKGFYNVFGEAFKQMAAEESVESPPFGGPNSTWEEVDKFYSFWTVFKTKRSFGFADLYHLKDAPNAIIRRAMKQDNKKARQKAEQAFLSSVHELALYVRKRDPRVSDHIEQMEEEKARREAENERKRQEQQRKIQEDLEKYVNEPKIDYTEDDLRYVRQFDQDTKAEGEPDWNCTYCNREMKNESAFRSHCKTKKHQKSVQNAKKKFIANPSSMEHTPLNYVLLCLSSEEIEEITGEIIDIDNEPLFIAMEEEEEEDKSEMEDDDAPKKPNQQKKNLSKKEKRKLKIQQEREQKEKEQEDQLKQKQNEKLSKKEKQKLRQQEQLLERQKIKEERKEKAEQMPKLSKKEKKRLKQQEERMKMLGAEEEDIKEPEPEQEPEQPEEQQQPVQEEPEEEPPKQEPEQEVEQQDEEEQNKGKQQKGKKGKKGKNEEKDNSKAPIQRAPKNMKNPPPGMFMCRTCRQLFPSKRKLFLHLEETKHATAYN